MKRRGRRNLIILISLSLIIFMVLLIFFIIPPQSNAENNSSCTGNICVSAANVSYEAKIVDYFNNRDLVKQAMSSKTHNESDSLEIINNETWVRVIIYLKNGTKIDNLISSFSDYELKDVINSQIKSTDESERIRAKITRKGFNKLINDRRVESIYYDVRAFLFLDKSAPLINTTVAWNLGYNGSEINICVIDSGVDKSNPALSGKVVAEKCYCNDSCCPNGQDESDNATDELGHGTQVAGIIASQDSTYRGVAYGANIYAVRVFGEYGEGGEIDDIKKAINWCHNQGVDIISMSFGIGNGENYSSPCQGDLDTQINNAYNDNITIIAASGNGGYTNGMAYPACQNNVISVGSTYDDNLGIITHGIDYPPYNCTDNAITDEIVCNSNRGTGLSLLAPGCEITSTERGEGFIIGCGTSMAAPHVAGAAAILLQKKPTLTPDQIKSILHDTGVSVQDWKRIDIEAALNSISNPQNDTFKFYIKDSAGNPVAWIGNLGDIVLKGSCFAEGDCSNPGSNSFIIKNSSKVNVAFINSSGDLCITNGDCSEESVSCNPTTKAFIMKNSSGYNMSYIDIEGDLCLTGKLYENSEYV